MRTRAEANRQRWAILAFAIAVLVLSFVILHSAYYQLVLTQVLLWAVLSLAWNLLCGYSGYFSFGHAAFWGGLLIGIVQQMSTLVLPYQLQNTAIFVVFLLIIFFRPQGMFGRLSERT